MGVMRELWKNFVGEVCSQHIVFGEGREYAGREGGKGMAFQKADDAKYYVFDSSLNVSSSAITLSRRGKYFSSIRWMASSRLESSGLSLPNRT